LLYLVNKLVVTSHIVKWLLFLQEFDSKVVYKPGWIHFVPNQLSQISHGEPTIRVKAQLLDAILFTLGWYGPILEYLQKGYFENNIPKKKEVVLLSNLDHIYCTTKFYTN
jgi:hypothetical protein